VAERLAISVATSSEHPEGLEVSDALMQLMDAFSLIVSSSPTPDIRWCIVDVKMNSPLTLVSEAFATRDNVDVHAVATLQKTAAESNFNSLIAGRIPAAWASVPEVRKRSMNFVARSANGIGQTVVRLFPDRKIDEKSVSADITINRETATVIQQVVRENTLAPVIQKSQVGSVDGRLLYVKKYYGKAAFWIQERRTAKEVRCIVASDNVKRIVEHVNFGDIWGGQRARIRGKIHYAKDGSIAEIDAFDVIRVAAAANFDLSALNQPGFTDGLDVVDYMNKLREGFVG
jgi:hypothetical protein